MSVWVQPSSYQVLEFVSSWVRRVPIRKSCQCSGAGHHGIGRVSYRRVYYVFCACTSATHIFALKTKNISASPVRISLEHRNQDFIFKSIQYRQIWTWHIPKTVASGSQSSAWTTPSPFRSCSRAGHTQTRRDSSFVLTEHVFESLADAQDRVDWSQDQCSPVSRQLGMK